jgi:hypothetical protein
VSTIASASKRTTPIANPVEALAHNRNKIVVTMNTCHDTSASHPGVRRESCANFRLWAIGLFMPDGLRRDITASTPGRVL